MIIDTENNVVSFISAWLCYIKELKGVKLNTVRFLNVDEAERLNKWYKSCAYPVIKINADDHNGHFARMISDVSVVDPAKFYHDMIAFPESVRLVIISWQHNE